MVPERDASLSWEALGRRAAAARALSHAIKRVAFVLKIASSITFVASAVVIACSITWPASALANGFLFAFYAFQVSILVKLFGPLVDLETRGIQFVLIAALTGMFLAGRAPSPWPV